jgi:hypothetical protein
MLASFGWYNNIIIIIIIHYIQQLQRAPILLQIGKPSSVQIYRQVGLGGPAIADISDT